MAALRDTDEVQKEEEVRRKEEDVVGKKQVDIGHERVRKRRATHWEREEIRELQNRVSDLENRLNIQDEQIRSLQERFGQVDPATHQRPPLFGGNSVVPATTTASTQQPPLFRVPSSTTSTAFTFGSTQQALVFGEPFNKKAGNDGDFVKPEPTSDSVFGPTNQPPLFGKRPIKTEAGDGIFAEPTSAPASGFGVTQHIGAQVAPFGASSSTTPAIDLSSSAPSSISGFRFGSSQQSVPFGASSSTTPAIDLSSSAPSSISGFRFGSSQQSLLFGSSSSRAPDIGTSFATPALTSTSTFRFCPSPALRSDGFGGNSSSALPKSTTTFGYTPDRLPFGIGANPGSVFDGSPFIPVSPVLDRSPLKSATSSSNPSPTKLGVHRCIKFKPKTGTDQMMKNGTSVDIKTRLQCITCMDAYKTKCVEELRLEDYLANRKTGTMTVANVKTTKKCRKRYTRQ